MGWLDPEASADAEDLSRIGELAADLLAVEPFLLVSSPLRRALMTAGEIAGKHDVERDARLQEWGLGDWQGLRYEEVRQRYPKWFNAQGYWDPMRQPPGGESFEMVEQRVADFMRHAGDLLAERPSLSVVVVTHNGIIRVMRYIAGEIPAERLFADKEAPLRLLPIPVPPKAE